MLQAESFLGRAILAARYRRPLIRIAVSPRWAGILVAAGAQRAPAGDAMTVSYSDTWRELELAILAARNTIRLQMLAFNEPLHPDHEMVGRLLAIDEVLQRVKERAIQAGYQSLGQRKALVPPSAITIRPRVYEDARFVGEHFRDGAVVVMDLGDMPDAIAKRLIDFAAGLVFASRGSIERITRKSFLLLPAAGPRDPNYLLQLVNTALDLTSGLLMAISDAVHASWLRDGAFAESVRARAKELRAITLPLDLSGIDLTDVTTVRMEDLDQAIWTASTKWPDATTAAQVEAASEEVAPGTYQVRIGTGHHPESMFLSV